MPVPLKTNRMDVALTLSFAVGICLPLVGAAFGWDLTHELGEKRVPARCPALGQDPLSEIPREFEAFYQDHFGFRNGLIQGHNWIRYKLFKGSSVGKVLFGKDDWLFLARSGILPDFLGQNPLTPAELDAWRNTLEQRQSWLAERGIRYLFVIAPNKATLYPEKLPDHIQRGRGRSRMDQLVDCLRDRSAVHFVDLRPTLNQAKTAGLVYHPRDTHWTDRGAFIVYEEICRRLGEWFPEIQAVSMDGFELARGRQASDLATMLGLGEELGEEAEVWTAKTPPAAKAVGEIVIPQHSASGDSKTRTLVVRENPQTQRRLVMFHDSFAVIGGLRERLSEHFRRSIFTWNRGDQHLLESLIEQERPDVVIEQIVERKLNDDLTESEVE